MSLWTMNDGSALTGTITTNGSVNLTGSGTNFDPEVKVNDIIVTAGGESVRVKTITSDTAIVLTAAATGSESGVAGTVRKPPTDGKVALPGTDIFGVSTLEGAAGSDNINAIGVSTSAALGTETYIGGNTYHGSAPTVTIAAPATHTIATSAVTIASETITITSHNMQTGTQLKYQDGSGTALAGLTDNTAYFVIKVDDNTIKLATSLANAHVPTVINLTGTGNNAQTLEGIQATGTATISGGKVTAVAVATVGSDYQSVPAVTIAAPAGSGSLDLTDAAVLIVASDEIVIPAAMYAVIATSDAVTYTQGGSGAQANLTTGTVYYLIKSGTSNRISLATSDANAQAGTKITLAAVASGGTAHTLIGATATVTASRGAGDTAANTSSGFHVGWVKRTVGTGGRAGRIQYETLVAASSISGDHEDIAFVENV